MGAQQLAGAARSINSGAVEFEFAVSQFAARASAETLLGSLDDD